MIVLDPAKRYRCSEVAAWLEHTPSWFSRNRAELERVDNFPRPISRVGKPRWLGADLIAWEQRDKHAPTITGPAAPMVVDFSNELRERALKVAGGKARNG